MENCTISIKSMRRLKLNLLVKIMKYVKLFKNIKVNHFNHKMCDMKNAEKTMQILVIDNFLYIQIDLAYVDCVV